MQKTLQVSQNSSILNSIHSLITTAVARNSTPASTESRNIKSSYINGVFDVAGVNYLLPVSWQFTVSLCCGV